jgi:error-prone DNA polymerase
MQCITDHDAMLRSIGNMNFSVAPGGDGRSNGGGPDTQDPASPRGPMLTLAPFGSIQEREEIVPTLCHDVH